MKTNKAGLELIKRFEGFSALPYRCPAGIPTIGYGNTFYPDGRRVTLQDPAIDEAEASRLLRATLESFEYRVDKITRDDISENQFSALVSFAFNVGTENLRKSTLLKLVNQNPLDPDIRREFKRWVYANGERLEGLSRRRSQEADLYFS